ncbi:MAG: transposase family protein [Corynebacterium matruchotii]|uniref:transposase family protein n=1 Tax=Corynebacterium matruchotii TaxID=43768 RepID=UPI0036112883
MEHSEPCKRLSELRLSFKRKQTANTATPINAKTANTPFKRRPGKPLLGCQRRFNKGINQIRYVVERSIAHLKVWRILSTPSRLPRNTTIRAINVIRRIMFYQPPAEPHFPSN